MDRITVLMIDEQPSFRVGLHRALSRQPDFKVYEYDPSEKPMSSIEAIYPDVIILSSDIAIVSSLELSREIARYYPNIRVIVMSPKANDDELFEFIKTAAVAYLDKKTTGEELYTTIRRSTRGEYPINESVMTRPMVAQHVLEQFREIALIGKGMERITAPLGHQEKLILTCVTNCITKKQIAHTLRVSERTVENHVSSILRKLITYERAVAAALSEQDSFIPVGR